MRLPKIRWTTRLWMGVVLIVALLTASAVMTARRSADYRRLAEWHAAEAARFAALIRQAKARQSAPVWAIGGPNGGRALRYVRSMRTPDYVTKADVEKAEAEVQRALQDEARGAMDPDASRLEYHRALKLKYETAAARPWEPVPSDPPAP